MSSVESIVNKNSSFPSSLSSNNKIILNGKDVLKFSTGNNSQSSSTLSPSRTISITANKLFNNSNSTNCNNNQLHFKSVINANSNNKSHLNSSPNKLTNSPSVTNSISSLMFKLNGSNGDKNITPSSSPIKIKNTNFNIPKNSPNKLEILMSSSLANGIKSLENKLSNDIKMIKIPKLTSTQASSSPKMYPVSICSNSDDNVFERTSNISLTSIKANSINTIPTEVPNKTNCSITNSANKFNKHNFIIHKKPSPSEEVYFNENENTSKSKILAKKNSKKSDRKSKMKNIDDRSRSTSKNSIVCSRSRSSSSCCSSSSTDSSSSSDSTNSTISYSSSNISKSSNQSTCSKNSLHNNNFDDTSYSPISDDSLLDTKNNKNNCKIKSKKRKLNKIKTTKSKKFKSNKDVVNKKTKPNRKTKSSKNNHKIKKNIELNFHEIKDELIKTNPTSSASSTPIKKFKNKSKIYETLIRKNISEQLNENDEKSHKSPSKTSKKRKTQISESKIDTFHQKLISSQSQQFGMINQKADNILLEFSTEEIKLFDSLITKEYDANGGAYILIAYHDELLKKLVDSNGDDRMLKKFSTYFLQLSYSETSNYDNSHYSQTENETMTDCNENVPTKEYIKDNSFMRVKESKKLAANYVLGIIRNSAANIPEIIDYFADEYPQMTVKSSLLLNNKEINTMKISEYRKCVNSTYLNGTYRFGPLLQISLVGCRNEEIGDYFPDFIEDHLEKNVFLKQVMPWGEMSVNYNMNPMNSDDGPIIWARPGEQMIPTSNLKDQHMLMSSNTISNNNSTNEIGKKKK